MALSYVRVVYRALDIIGDTDDPGREPDTPALPDATLTLTVPVGMLKDTNSEPAVTYFPQPIVGTFDADGNLLDAQGNQGVLILDPEIVGGYDLACTLSATNRPPRTFIARLTQADDDGSYDLTTNRVENT